MISLNMSPIITKMFYEHSTQKTIQYEMWTHLIVMMKSQINHSINTLYKLLYNLMKRSYLIQNYTILFVLLAELNLKSYLEKVHNIYFN